MWLVKYNCRLVIDLVNRLSLADAVRCACEEGFVSTPSLEAFSLVQG